MAELIAGVDPDWATLRARYEGDGTLTVPPVVLSFPRGQAIELSLTTP